MPIDPSRRLSKRWILISAAIIGGTSAAALTAAALWADGGGDGPTHLAFLPIFAVGSLLGGYLAARASAARRTLEVGAGAVICAMVGLATHHGLADAELFDVESGSLGWLASAAAVVALSAYAGSRLAERRGRGPTAIIWCLSLASAIAGLGIFALLAVIALEMLLPVVAVLVIAKGSLLLLPIGSGFLLQSGSRDPIPDRVLFVAPFVTALVASAFALATAAAIGALVVFILAGGAFGGLLSMAGAALARYVPMATDVQLPRARAVK